ncbi:aryl-alcohol oxidase [Armillaria novae-zelandiae]|uniref:Aryl-alcohol oxidase n=1 Tax=Armillaria novae-zelandiae TaxID=153914 RepID=A0AA39PC27_9AGAR|nr:aryl-alcohol oxidase [Armillaria novae-zelandiae]
MYLRLHILFGLYLWASSCYGAIYESVADLPGTKFDFVVVGGGAGGAVVANRLTEEDFSVLVLEAGPSDRDLLSLEVPYLVDLLGSEYTWNYSTTVQPGLNNKTTVFPRGYVLGGSTSINGMAGLGRVLEPYAFKVIALKRSVMDANFIFIGTFLQNEKWVPPADGHNTTGQYDPAIHSLDGMVAVSLAGYPRSTDERVLQTTSELPDEFPFLLDINSGIPDGIGYMQATINDGKRSSSSASYLGPEFINRENLHVLLGAQVTKVIQSDESELTFDIVEFSASSEGSMQFFNVTAAKEIILSAGAIGTPHILLNSGIGDARELLEVGIQAIVDLPDVGKNLSDQPSAGGRWYVNDTNTWDNIVRNLTYRNELVRQWNETRTGPLVDTPPTHILWSRLPDDSPIFERFDDPAAGPNTPHLEIGFSNAWNIPASLIPDTGNFISLGVSVVSPVSRGTVKLNSSDPLDPPLIDPAFLASEFDCGRAMSWTAYGDLVNATTDEALEEYPSMSPRFAEYGVVDPDLLVKGVSGLRVVDASIFPFVPAGHTQAPTYIIAERAADLIKATWLGSPS